MLSPYKKQLVLVGGGHANVQVLKSLCMNQYIGLHTILINDGQSAIYSGMTPGYIQKKYTLDEISIDLQRLCFNANVTFINDKVVNIDLENKNIFLKKLPFVKFDFLSINSGSISNVSCLEIDSDAVTISAKPISSLVQNLTKIDKFIEKSKNKKILSIIGGGVASFEIALSFIERYQNKISLNIVSPTILNEKNINTFSKKELLRICQMNKIEIIRKRVSKISNSFLISDNKEKIFSDINILSNGATIEPWLRNTNLAKDKFGFIEASQTLESLSHRDIFISGDILSLKKFKRSKSGVMAVRQGGILKKNIFLKIQNKELKQFKPQNNWLYLITTLKNKALMNYYFLTLHNSWCLALKNFIDLRFLNKFKFKEGEMNNKKLHQIHNHNIQNKSNMYCQGCGSKVSKDGLIEYLKFIKKNLILEDSSILSILDKKILQTIDHIKLFSSIDPYTFGRISYLHSQNDILASGGQVTSISISIGVPFSENYVENFYLTHFVEGIRKECSKSNAVIAAGHSYQTLEPSTTITMNGKIHNITSKGKARNGDLIYITKPLGVGYLLTAYFNNSKLLKCNDIQEIINCLMFNNKKTCDLALKLGSEVMTDISGFGLASHLGDICLNSNLSCNIYLDEKILINKNLQILEDYKSTGFENNYNSMKDLVENEETNIINKILYDPQTNGPMLIIINPKKKSEFKKITGNNLKYSPLLIGSFVRKDNKLIYVKKNIKNI